MNILLILVPIALLLALTFLGFFFWATKNGQFDDLETPSYKAINDDLKVEKFNKIKTKGQGNE